MHLWGHYLSSGHRDKARYLRLSRSSSNFRHCETPSATLPPRQTTRAPRSIYLARCIVCSLSSHVCRTGSSQAGVGAKGAIAGMFWLPTHPLPYCCLFPQVPARTVGGVRLRGVWYSGKDVGNHDDDGGDANREIFVRRCSTDSSSARATSSRRTTSASTPSAGRGTPSGRIRGWKTRGGCRSWCRRG